MWVCVRTHALLWPCVHVCEYMCVSTCVCVCDTVRLSKNSKIKKKFNAKAKAKLFGGVQGCSRILSTLSHLPISPPPFLSWPLSLLLCCRCEAAAAAASPVSDSWRRRPFEMRVVIVAVDVVVVVVVVAAIWVRVSCIRQRGQRRRMRRMPKWKVVNWTFFLVFALAFARPSVKGQEQGWPGNGNWSLVTGIGIGIGFHTLLRASGVRFYILWAICTFLRSALFAVVEAASAFFTFLSLSLSFLFYFTACAFVWVCVCLHCVWVGVYLL